MAEWLTHLTAFRDVLLLFVDAGIFAALCSIAVLLVVFLRRQEAARADQASLLALLADRNCEGSSEDGLADFKRSRTNPDNGRLESLVANWLDQIGAQHDRLLNELKDRRETVFTAGDFRELIEQNNDSIRSLIGEWREENLRRAQANNELRDAIREDVRDHSRRLKQLLERSPAPIPVSTATTGTITASAESDAAPDWEREFRGEMRLIVDKLDRMSERLDEIFQI